MKFKEARSAPSYRRGIDDKCAHCMGPFEDEDELGRCVLTDHYTHSTCVGHDG